MDLNAQQRRENYPFDYKAYGYDVPAKSQTVDFGNNKANAQRPLTEFEQAHLLAQQRAALPVNQRGLDLPANNTLCLLLCPFPVIPLVIAEHVAIWSLGFPTFIGLNDTGIDVKKHGDNTRLPALQTVWFAGHKVCAISRYVQQFWRCT